MFRSFRLMVIDLNVEGDATLLSMSAVSCQTISCALIFKFLNHMKQAYYILI